MEIPLVTGGYCEGRSNEYDSQKSSHRIADEWNLGKEEDQTMTQPFGNFHAIPLNIGKTKELCSDIGQQTSLPIESMQQNLDQLGRYRTCQLPLRLIPLRTCGFCKLLMSLAHRSDERCVVETCVVTCR